MQLSITGKNLEINDNLRKYVEKKIGRLDRYLPNIIDGRVELTVEEGARAAEDRQIAQVTLRTKNAILRAEEASGDMFASVDAVFEKMQRQADYNVNANQINVLYRRKTGDYGLIQPELA